MQGQFILLAGVQSSGEVEGAQRIALEQAVHIDHIVSFVEGGREAEIAHLNVLDRQAVHTEVAQQVGVSIDVEDATIPADRPVDHRALIERFQVLRAHLEQVKVQGARRIAADSTAEPHDLILVPHHQRIDHNGAAVDLDVCDALIVPDAIAQVHAARLQVDREG